MSARSLEGEDGGLRSLLVIDDEPEIVRALFRQFRRDYVVHTATSAADGLQIMAEQPVHVVITDQRMPEMAGSSFLARIKGDYPDAIRLLLTGYADIQVVIKAINEGAVYRYITKPWDPLELESTVRQAFDAHRLIDRNARLMAALEEANAHLEERVRQRTAELDGANARLRALDEVKNEFLGMAAHDLRNPLCTISGAAKLMLEMDLSESVRRELLDSVSGASEYMLDLINDLLDVATIEQGQITLQTAPMAAMDLLERVLHQNRHAATAKGIELRMEGADGLPLLRIDPARVTQVLNNLVSNALKFSYPGTSVTVSVRATDGPALELSVQDEGQGIPDDEIDKVFGKFHRGSLRATGGERSTGLGLAISKVLIERHGGAIEVDSEVGVGSCFRFTLPTVDAPTPAEP